MTGIVEIYGHWPTPYFQIAAKAVADARLKPTQDRIDHAIRRCHMEWARGGSPQSGKMLLEATRLVAQSDEAKA